MSTGQAYQTAAEPQDIHFAPVNILVATDFSPSAERALDYALAIARRYDSRIYLTHVLTPAGYQFVPPEVAAATYLTVRQGAEQALTDILISGRLREVPHEVLLEEGLVWPAVELLIRQKEADLVVIGTRGRTGAKKVVMGSSAEEIIRKANCPVLTVGPGVLSNGLHELEWGRILFATDLLHTPERAAQYALSLAQEYQAHLTLLHVVEHRSEASERGIAFERKIFTHRLEQLVPPGVELWCDPQLTVVFGSPAEEILITAEVRNADLIVMGARAGRGLVGHSPFSTAHRVVSQAVCPVLTVNG